MEIVSVAKEPGVGCLWVIKLVKSNKADPDVSLHTQDPPSAGCKTPLFWG